MNCLAATFAARLEYMGGDSGTSPCRTTLNTAMGARRSRRLEQCHGVARRRIQPRAALRDVRDDRAPHARFPEAADVEAHALDGHLLVRLGIEEVRDVVF